MKRLWKWLLIYPRYRWSRYDVLVRRGAVATLVFFVGVAIYLASARCVTREAATICKSKFLWWWNSSPNEFGDTLAGIAGALAFLWIIVTVMLQSKELGAQRQELKLARKESEKMARALQAQAKVFRDEQRQRSELEAKNEFDELLKLLRAKLTTNPIIWEFVANPRGAIGFNAKYNPEESEQIFFHSWHKEAQRSLRQVRREATIRSIKKAQKNNYLDTFEAAANLIKLQPRLSASQRTRAKRLKIEEIRNFLEEIGSEDLWQEKE